MCLGTITKIYKKPKHFHTSKIGWKIFVKYGKLFNSIYRTTFQTIEANKWITDEKEHFIPISYSEKYYTGFHFFEFKKDALQILKNDYLSTNNLVLKKIKYNYITAIGEEQFGNDNRKIIVARKIKIIN